MKNSLIKTINLNKTKLTMTKRLYWLDYGEFQKSRTLHDLKRKHMLLNIYYFVILDINKKAFISLNK